MDWAKEVTIDNNTFICYEIGSMEAPAENDGGTGWRQYLTPRLNWRGIYAFDPTFEEKAKIGMPTNEFMEKLTELQLSSEWEEFTRLMKKVWQGNSYSKKLKSGEYETIRIMGDLNYVEYSNFLIWHHKDGDKPGGTIIEMFYAWTKGIPVYLVTDMPIVKMNKSILFFLLDSGHGQGRIFKNFDELLKFLDKKYKLIVKEK